MAKVPAKTEALEEPKTYVFDGETYTIPEDLDEVGLMDSYENGRVVNATKALVGQELFDKLRADGKLRKMEELNALVEAALPALGATMGE